MIEVKNLVKKYGDHTAVDNLSFTVKKGQIYGFLGANGAGKSTTMNIMTGYLAATDGTVIINGHDISEEPEEAKKCIGYLPEIPPLYTDMTVVEYLDFCAELKAIPKAEREAQVDQVIEMTKLEDVAVRLIRNLSKGYKQRVGLAQAILGFPDIIILDEPTVGLDPRQIIDIRELIRELAKEHTIILSSHIMQEVSAVCDHILIISKGKLVASDTPENLQKLLAGDNTLKMTIKGGEAEIRRALRSVKAIDSMNLTASEEAGCTDAVIRSDNSRGDIREAVFYCLAEAKCPIMELTHDTVSLEDIFLELTGDNVSQEMISEATAEENAAKEQVQAAEGKDGEE